MSDDRKELLAQIESMARDVAGRFGVEIVEFVFHSQGRHSLLRIDIDRPGVPGAGLADCENVSRALSAEIDDLPFFGSPYELQVSSPGIDRPIRSDDDVRRNTGRSVRLEFRDDLDKVRELRGTLRGRSSSGAVSIESEGTVLEVPMERIVLMKQDVAVGRGKRERP